jgi:hypothetical protein
MGPSAIDAELRSISMCETSLRVNLIQNFLNFILYLLTTKNNFELTNAYLALTLKLHGDQITNSEDLSTSLEQIRELHSLAWLGLKMSLNKNLCLVSYLKSVV